MRFERSGPTWAASHMEHEDGRWRFKGRFVDPDGGGSALYEISGFHEDADGLLRWPAPGDLRLRFETTGVGDPEATLAAFRELVEHLEHAAAQGRLRP